MGLPAVSWLPGQSPPWASSSKTIKTQRFIKMRTSHYTLMVLGAF